MYLNQKDQNPLNSSAILEQQPPLQQITLLIHHLQQFLINSYYSLCSLPSINQFFENINLTDKAEGIDLKLNQCKLDKFRRMFCSDINQQENHYIFYLYSGRILLTKNKQDQSYQNQSLLPHGNHSNQNTTHIRKNNSVFISSIDIHTNTQNDEDQYYKKSNTIDKRNIFDKASAVEIKQGSFFTLWNLKKIMDPQKYTIFSVQPPQLSATNNNNKCLITYLKINPKYNIHWYLAEAQKYLFVSSIFRGGKDQISQTKLKAISHFFQSEKYRRGVVLTKQNQQNNRLLIMHEGQCEYSKTFTSPLQPSTVRHVRIANAGPSSIFGSQFLLYQYSGFSKPVAVTTQALIDKYSKKQSIYEELDEEEEQIKNISKSQHHHKHSSSSSKLSPSKSRKHIGQIYTPHKNVQKIQQKQVILTLHKSAMSNFQVTVTSAYAEFYYISVQKFKELCSKYVHQLPFNVRNIVENYYVTLLRNLKEKIQLQLIKIKRNISKASADRIMFEAKVKSGQYGTGSQVLIGIGHPNTHKNNMEGNQKNHTGYGQINNKLKINKTQLISNDLKNRVTDLSRNRKLQKKIQFALQDKKQIGDFKKKIQTLLKQKLLETQNHQVTTTLTDSQYRALNVNVQRLTKSPELLNNKLTFKEKTSQGLIPYQKQKLMQDLQEIFMNKQQNSRSQSIGRQNQILSKKQNLLKKRYNSMNNVLIVHEQSYDHQKNKMFRMDLLRKGVKIQTNQKQSQQHKRNLDMKNYSNRIKNIYTQKINSANKIKQQFMTIRSECQNCHCYDDIQGVNSTLFHNKDPKNQTMKTGSAWRISETNFYSQKPNKEQPLQKLHSRTKFISEKVAAKYHHNEHIKNKRKGLVISLDKNNRRKLSAPNFGNY